ncbi:hypothetical protein KWH02_20465 [Xanthomonas campestris pv. uppalii]|nr:hypothetical protein [Xanthomonas campestris pv. uppalii]
MQACILLSSGCADTLHTNQGQEIHMNAIRWIRSSGAWALLAAVAILLVALLSHSLLGLLLGYVCLTISALYVMFAAPDATGSD